MIEKLKQSQSYSCAPMGDSSDSGSDATGNSTDEETETGRGD